MFRERRVKRQVEREVLRQRRVWDAACEDRREGVTQQERVLLALQLSQCPKRILLEAPARTLIGIDA